MPSKQSNLLQSISTINVKVKNPHNKGLSSNYNYNKDLKSVASSLKHESSSQLKTLQYEGKAAVLNSPQDGSKQIRTASIHTFHGKKRKSRDRSGDDVLLMIGAATLTVVSGGTINNHGAKNENKSGAQENTQSRRASFGKLSPSKGSQDRYSSLRIEGEAKTFNAGDQKQGYATAAQFKPFKDTSMSSASVSHLPPGRERPRAELNLANYTPKFDSTTSPKHQMPDHQLSKKLLSVINPDSPKKQLAHQDTNRSALSLTYQEAVPTVSVSRRYHNSSTNQDDHVVLDQSYIKDVIQVTLSEAPEKVIYVQDGDLVYQITGKDMGLFTMLCDKLKAKADRLKMMESMSGVYKHLHKEQTFGHMRKNLRPHTAEGLLKKIYDQEQLKKDKKAVVDFFFSYLQQQGKAKILRSNDNQEKTVYSRDIINSNEMVQQVVKHLSQQQVTDNVSYIPEKAQEQLDPMRLQGVMCSPKTIFKRIYAPNSAHVVLSNHKASNAQNSAHQQSTEDFMMMIGNPLVTDVDQRHLPQGNKLFSRQHQASNIAKSASVAHSRRHKTDNRENLGDTRNEFYLSSGSGMDQRRRGELFKSDERSINKLLNLGRETPNILNMTENNASPGTRRRQVNINNKSVTASARTHLRQTGQALSSFVESSKAPHMQPLLNEGHDDITPRVYTEELVEQEGMMKTTGDNIVEVVENLKGKISIVVQEGGTQTADLLFNSFQLSSQGQRVGPNLSLVRAQEFIIPIKERVRSGSPEHRENSPEILGGGYNTHNSGGMTKFSNTQIKKHIHTHISTKKLHKQSLSFSKGKDVMSTDKKHTFELRNISPSGGRQRPFAQSNQKFYDTPQFGDNDSLELIPINAGSSIHIPEMMQGSAFKPQGSVDGSRLNTDIEQHLQRKDSGQNESAKDEGDKSPKKNVLISKKQPSPSAFDPTLISGDMSPSGTTMHHAESGEHNDGAHQEQPPNEDALLEHIIEETCESVDSLLGGLGDIIETMKSNFNPPPQSNVPAVVHKEKKKLLRNHLQPKIVVEESRQQSSEMGNSATDSKQQMKSASFQDLIAMSRTEAKPSRTQAQKGSVTPNEVLESELIVQGHGSKVFSKIASYHNIAQVATGELPPPAIINSHRSSNRNFDVVQSADGVKTNLTPVQRLPQSVITSSSPGANQNAMRVISKLSLQGQQSQAFFGTGVYERPRQPIEYHLLPGDTRNLTNPNSLGEMNGKPVYTPDLQELKREGGITAENKTLKGEQSSSIIPPPILKQRLNDDVLFAAPPSQQNRPHTGQMGTSQVKWINNRKQPSKDMAISTDEQKHQGKQRTNVSVGTVVQLLPDVNAEQQAKDICKDTFQGNKKTQKPTFKLDSKQEQMLRRNISVQRKVGKRLREMNQVIPPTQPHLPLRMQLHHNSELSEKSSTKMGANFHTPMNESMNQSANLGLLPNNSVQDPDLYFMSMNPSVMHLNNNIAVMEQYVNSMVLPHQKHPLSTGHNHDISDSNIEGGYGDLGSTSQIGIHVVSNANYVERMDSSMPYRHEDSSTIKEESISQTLHLTTPKITQQPKSHHKIRLPATEAPVSPEGRGKDVRLSHNGNASLTTEQMNSYIQQMIAMNQSTMDAHQSRLGRRSADIYRKRASQGHKQLPAEYRIQDSNNSSALNPENFQHLLVNTLNGPSIHSSTNYRQQAFANHRKLKSSVGTNTTRIQTAPTSAHREQFRNAGYHSKRALNDTVAFGSTVTLRKSAEQAISITPAGVMNQSSPSRFGAQQLTSFQVCGSKLRPESTPGRRRIMPISQSTRPISHRQAI